MNINGVEYVLVPKVATDAMINAARYLLPSVPRVCMDDAIERAIAAAPPVPTVEVTDAVCERVSYAFAHQDYSGSEITPMDRRKSDALLYLRLWQSELGPALGLSVWREPTDAECKLRARHIRLRARSYGRRKMSYRDDLKQFEHERYLETVGEVERLKGIAARADAEIAELRRLLGDCRQVIAWEYGVLDADPRGRESEHAALGALVQAIDAARGGE